MLPSIIEKFGSVVPIDKTMKLCGKDGFQGSAEQEAERHFAAVAKQFRSESEPYASASTFGMLVCNETSVVMCLVGNIT